MSAVPQTAPLFDQPRLDVLPVEHLCDLGVDLEPPLIIPTPRGTFAHYIGKGGGLEGPRLRGRLLPGSVDWVLLAPDGVSRLDVRGVIVTDDDALISYEARGVVKLPPDGRQRLAAGERLPFAETYIRTTPKLETSDERYAWLNDAILVGYNELSPGHIDFRIYRVL
jgi:hypothetical protein